MSVNNTTGIVYSVVGAEIAQQSTNDPRKTGAYFQLHSNVKVLFQAVHALGRIGGELYIEPTKYGLGIKSFNKTKSAYGVFLFGPDFFSNMDTSFLDTMTSGNTTCRISMKSAHVMSKSAVNVDRNSLICSELWVNPDADRLFVEFKLAFDVSRVYDFFVMDVLTAFKPTFDRKSLKNMTVAAADTLCKLIEMMRSDVDELIIVAHPDKFAFKNYCKMKRDDLGRRRTVRTDAEMQLESCAKHKVETPTEIGFNLREFLGAMHFAKQFCTLVTLTYDRPGRPLVISLETSENYSAEFIIATTQVEAIQADESHQILWNQEDRRSQARAREPEEGPSTSSEIRVPRPTDNTVVVYDRDDNPVLLDVGNDQQEPMPGQPIEIDENEHHEAPVSESARERSDQQNHNLSRMQRSASSKGNSTRLVDNHESQDFMAQAVEDLAKVEIKPMVLEEEQKFDYIEEELPATPPPSHLSRSRVHQNQANDSFDTPPPGPSRVEVEDEPDGQARRLDGGDHDRDDFSNDEGVAQEPPRKKRIENNFKHFFLGHGLATQHPSQRILNDTVLAGDSDDDF